MSSGYFRLLLIVLGWVFFDRLYVFLPLYAVSAFLDGIDGCIARRLGQCSAFGAWLDVLVDNVGRSVIWAMLYDWGVFVVCIEWTVFVCTHTLGHTWKQAFGAAPWWVKMVMDNGFYTATGVFTIAGIHGLPPYLYFYHNQPQDLDFLQASGIKVLLIVPIVVLITARALGLAVELWCIKAHIVQLIHLEENKTVRTLTKDFDRSDSPT